MRYDLTPNVLYFFVNNQCVLSCPNKYYPDSTIPSLLFCRDCPSGCNVCTNEMSCSQCLSSLFLETSYAGTVKLCVEHCKSGFYGNTVSGNCQSCISNCKNCSTSTNCF